MKRGSILSGLTVILVIGLMVTRAYPVNDYPHFGKNSIGCDSCHFIFGTQPSLLPPWTEHVQQDIDDTQFHTLCMSCHNDVDAPFVKTHSSLTMDDEDYGTWSVECRVCHSSHWQRQVKVYDSDSYLYSGASTGMTTTTLTKTGAGWTENEYQGYVLYPNVSRTNYNYEILSNTADTITVHGPINLTKAAVGNTFAVIYGNLIQDMIDLSKITITPAKSGSR
ncbi:MAG: cytochrome c3 family protein, partial [Nitrospirota bacterium]